MQVLSNTALSLDGRTARRSAPRLRMGSAADLVEMKRLRGTVDAVLVGGNTFRAWPLALASSNENTLLQAILTNRGVLSVAERFRPSPGVRLVILGGPDLDTAAHEHAFDAEVETTPTPSLRWALSQLSARGAQRVLLECGGQLLHQALKDDVLDEVHITLCPVVLGGVGEPGFVDGPPLGALGHRLKLVNARPIDDEVFLTYRRP